MDLMSNAEITIRPHQLSFTAVVYFKARLYPLSTPCKHTHVYLNTIFGSGLARHELPASVGVHWKSEKRCIIDRQQKSRHPTLPIQGNLCWNSTGRYGSRREWQIVDAGKDGWRDRVPGAPG